MTKYGHWIFGIVAVSLVAFSAESMRNAAFASPPVMGEPLTAPPKGEKAPKPDKKKIEDKDEDEGASSKKVRWGKRRNETNEDYDKRFTRMKNKVKKDKKGDYSGGQFVNEKGEMQMWTLMGHPFIVRTDVDQEFTANTAMYMEMLHREYGAAYRALLGGVTADLREPIEVIVFSEQSTYHANGGPPGSGGFFAFGHLSGDRMAHWKARRYRLQQFTGGTKDFAKWEKGTLKHEAAHMEIQLRLGNTLIPGANIGVPIRAPRWFNEGHASVFEWWDFDKTADENLGDIPNKGRYAPVIRRVFGTDKWKDFDYIWTIDDATWSNDMTSQQGFLNYCQAWSLAGYMMGGGVKGKRDFQAVFGLTRKVGGDRQTTLQGDRKISWEEKFPTETKKSLDENWTKWVAENVSSDKIVPDEEFMCRENGINPAIKDRLEFFEGDERKANREFVEAERDRREKDPDRIER